MDILDKIEAAWPSLRGLIERIRAWIRGERVRPGVARGRKFEPKKPERPWINKEKPEKFVKPKEWR
jgi:hypothetical protein